MLVGHHLKRQSIYIVLLEEAEQVVIVILYIPSTIMERPRSCCKSRLTINDDGELGMVQVHAPRSAGEARLSRHG